MTVMTVYARIFRPDRFHYRLRSDGALWTTLLTRYMAPVIMTALDQFSSRVPCMEVKPYSPDATPVGAKPFGGP